MRITVGITCPGQMMLNLPLHHQHIVQGFLYKNFSKEMADFLHNAGFENSGRVFKLFCFSRLTGKFRISGGEIIFIPPVNLTLSSPLDKLLSEFVNSLLRKKNLKLGGNKIVVENILIHKKPSLSMRENVYFLTPVTVYSTLYTGDGKKKTYYYSPFEPEFGELIRKNLFKKYEAFHKKSPAGKFSIKPVGVTSHHEKVLKYKDFIIKGWLGNYEIEGSRKLLEFAYDAGLGSKNSQGFGMFEIAQK